MQVYTDYFSLNVLSVWLDGRQVWRTEPLAWEMPTSIVRFQTFLMG